jgi:hypothetical protein
MSMDEDADAAVLAARCNAVNDAAAVTGSCSAKHADKTLVIWMQTIGYCSFPCICMTQQALMLSFALQSVVF